MTEKPFFITIHGIDGTGKTTTADTLTRELISNDVKTVNYDIYEKEKQTNPFSPAKTTVLSEASPSAQFAYYLGSTLYHSDQISRLMQEGNSVVKSRYIDDVLAHHAQLGVDNASVIAQLFPILQPNLRVILTTREESRRTRIINRGELDIKDKEERKLGSRLDFFENYLLTTSDQLSISGQVIKIDTTFHSPQKVVQHIIDHLYTMQLLCKEANS